MLRIMDWNIEWMNNWFVGGNEVAWRDTHAGIPDVQALAQRVADVIDGLDPDVLTIQEGPSDRREMELFANGFLTDVAGNPRFTIFQGIDGAAQKVYILVKAGGALQNPAGPMDVATNALIDPWEADVDGDLVLADYNFTRTPLVIEGQHDGSPLRIMTLHTKSKFVNRGQQLWNDPTTRQQFVAVALVNRRRISAEAMRGRRYLDALLAEHPDRRIVVTGDFNDGPGFDFFETHYVTHGVTDILLGSVFYPELQFEHAILRREPDAFTAIFDDYIDNIDDRELLLDHIICSPGLAGQHTGRVASAEFLAAEDTTIPAEDRARHVSDHRPILVDIA